MALLDHITSWEGKRIYIFRDREILTGKGGDTADAGAVASLADCIRQSCEDKAVNCCGILLKSGTPAPAGYDFTPIPAYFHTHDDVENALAARMKGYAHWLADNRFCAACGQPLQLHESEHALVCPACGRLYYPRIEPCIITLISRGDEIRRQSGMALPGPVDGGVLCRLQERGDPDPAVGDCRCALVPARRAATPAQAGLHRLAPHPRTLRLMQNGMPRQRHPVLIQNKTGSYCVRAIICATGVTNRSMWPSALLAVDTT